MPTAANKQTIAKARCRHECALLRASNLPSLMSHQSATRCDVNRHLKDMNINKRMPPPAYLSSPLPALGVSQPLEGSPVKGWKEEKHRKESKVCLVFHLEQTDRQYAGKGEGVKVLVRHSGQWTTTSNPQCDAQSPLLQAVVCSRVTPNLTVD